MAQTRIENSKRHIAIYLPSLHGGGAERVMITLANGFADRGHKVDLVLVRAEGPYLSEVGQNVRVINLNKGRVLSSLIPLVCYLRKQRPDSMLSALNHANIIAIVAKALARVKTRLVVSERNSLVSIRGSNLFRLMQFFYPYADGVIAVSQGVAKELITEFNLPAERVIGIPNPVNASALTEKSLEQLQHPWFSAGEPPVILAVGRLNIQKDYSTLINAFVMLRTERNARLVILGEGELRSELEQQITNLGLSDDVALVGFQPNPFNWMAACSVYVMSSRYEGFPNSLVQAMACGAKVVSTNCPTGPEEILEGGVWGQLVSVGDSGALASAIVSAMKDQSPPDGKKRIKSFHPERIIHQYEMMVIHNKWNIT